MLLWEHLTISYSKVENMVNLNPIILFIDALDKLRHVEKEESCLFFVEK